MKQVFIEEIHRDSGFASTSINNKRNSSNNSRTKTFFQRTQSGVLDSKDALNEYLESLGVTDGQFNRHTFLSSCGTRVYHVSLIDYLQQWNFDKKSEAFAKKWFLGKNAKKISAVPPEPYAQRFLTFMRRNIFLADKVEGNNFNDEESPFE